METTTKDQVDYQSTDTSSSAPTDNTLEPPIDTPPKPAADQTSSAANRTAGDNIPAEDDHPAISTAPCDDTGPGDTTGGGKKGDPAWNKVFTREDGILYSLILVILIGFGYIFYDVQIRTISSVATQPSTAFWTQPTSEKTDLQFLNYHVAVADMRYRQARYITASITTRRNLAFLVGTAMAILGCMVIIRGVRGESSEVDVELKDAYAKILSNSPGLIVVFLGTLILLSTIWKVDEVNVSDPPIQLGGQGAERSNNSNGADAGAEKQGNGEVDPGILDDIAE